MASSDSLPFPSAAPSSETHCSSDSPSSPSRSPDKVSDPSVSLVSAPPVTTSNFNADDKECHQVQSLAEIKQQQQPLEQQPEQPLEKQLKQREQQPLDQQQQQPLEEQQEQPLEKQQEQLIEKPQEHILESQQEQHKEQQLKQQEQQPLDQQEQPQQEQLIKKPQEHILERQQEQPLEQHQLEQSESFPAAVVSSVRSSLRHPPPINTESLLAISPYPIYSSYIVKEKVGQGTWGSVHVAIERSSGLERTVKKIPKRYTSELTRFRQEIIFLKSLDHPNIVRLYETFEDYANIYMVMEYCRGGELFDRIIRSKYFSEETAAALMYQMLSSICYIHRKHLAHRDLKPENFLFLSNDDRSPMKLIDFGLAKRFNTRRCMRTKVGTLYYVSPEVLNGSYDEKCDMWSAGVIMYLLLCGTPPFNGPTDASIIQKISQSSVSFSEASWKNVSPIAQDFVKLLLHRDTTLRPTASEALGHPWFKLFSPSFSTSLRFVRPASVPVLSNLYRAEERQCRLDEGPTPRHEPQISNLHPCLTTTAADLLLSDSLPVYHPHVVLPHPCCSSIIRVHSPLCPLAAESPAEEIQQPPVVVGSECCRTSSTVEPADLVFAESRVSPSIMEASCGCVESIPMPGPLDFGANVHSRFRETAARRDTAYSTRSVTLGELGVLHEESVVGSTLPSSTSTDSLVHLAMSPAARSCRRLRVCRNLAKNLIPRWKRFARHNQLKRAALRVLAHQIYDGDHINHLRTMFLALDSNHDGALSAEELALGTNMLLECTTPARQPGGTAALASTLGSQSTASLQEVSTSHQHAGTHPCGSSPPIATHMRPSSFAPGHHCRSRSPSLLSRQSSPVVSPRLMSPLCMSQSASAQSLGKREKDVCCCGGRLLPECPEQTHVSVIHESSMGEDLHNHLSSSFNGDEVDSNDGDSVMSLDEMKMLVNEVSLDGGDTLEFSDFIAATMEKEVYMSENVLRAAFRVFDRDGDGRISSKELGAALGWLGPFAIASSFAMKKNAAFFAAGPGSEMDPFETIVDEEIRRIVKKCDADGDGTIGFEDFARVLQCDCDFDI